MVQYCCWLAAVCTFTHINKFDIYHAMHASHAVAAAYCFTSICPWLIRRPTLIVLVNVKMIVVCSDQYKNFAV